MIVRIGLPHRGARRLLAPEVIQTSAMDCGPASLKSLLDGHGIPVSYGRLREACQTDVDGSSIDTMEEIARGLGLDAEQVMVPADHLLLPESHSLPCIAVVRQPNGFTHFVVVWRTHGPLVQLMDPATGRRWRSREGFLDEIFIHSMPVPADAWRSYAGGDEFLGGLRGLMRRMGVERSEGERLITQAAADPAWTSLAALDAAIRITGSIARSGALRSGKEISGLLKGAFEECLRDADSESPSVPADYWSVRPAPPDDEETPQLQLRGAVLVRVSGVRDPDAVEQESIPLSGELLRALDEPPPRPGRELLALLRADGALAPLAVAAALVVAATGLVLEALLFRGLFDIGRNLALPEQRIAAMGAFLLVALLVLLIDLPVATLLFRLGRRLEIRLRLAFMRKIPRLGDRYFQSRPISDMAERGHSMHNLRSLPDLGGQLLRTVAQFLLTIAGIIWLDPAAAPVAVAGGILLLVLPLSFLPLLSERDLKARTHVGALGRFYLDALLGLIAIRTHGAERSVRLEHESLLVEWARTSFGLQRAAVLVEGLQSVAGMGLAAWLLFDHLGRSGGGGGGILLLAYWGLQLPLLGGTIGLLARQYPAQRNMVLRLMEPLGAPEEGMQRAETFVNEDLPDRPTSGNSGTPPTPQPGIAISMRDVRVVAAGHTILDAIDLDIPPGSHVAIVGQSGAGKSSFAGILLGWHRPSSGEVLVDGEPLDEAGIARLRGEAAWVDPAVQLWNRSFIDNLVYGGDQHPARSPGKAIECADLRGVLERLPDGLLTSLGESGGLVSGGEGQRVRLGRAMLRENVRLVILDEPFRGLDRERRRILLGRARELWRNATLLCITHDVSETAAFERVLVLHQGRVVEDDLPASLAAQPGSQYRALLDADAAVREGAWSDGQWRRLRLEEGRLVDSPEDCQ